MQSSDSPQPRTAKHPLKQEDFFAQLTQVMRQYDLDGDGILSDEDWQRASNDLAKSG